LSPVRKEKRFRGCLRNIVDDFPVLLLLTRVQRMDGGAIYLVEVVVGVAVRTDEEADSAVGVVGGPFAGDGGLVTVEAGDFSAAEKGGHVIAFV
jgi:hypothetical protein